MNIAAASRRRRHSNAIVRPSLHSISGEFLGNVGAHRLGGGEVGGGTGGIALLAPDDAAPEEGAGELRAQRHGPVVVGERAVEPAELELDQCAAVEGVGGVRLEAERFVAVVEPRLEVADDGAGAAAVAPCGGIADCPDPPFSKFTWPR